MIEFVSIQEFSLACIIYVATIAANNEEVRLLIPRLTEGLHRGLLGWDQRARGGAARLGDPRPYSEGAEAARSELSLGLLSNEMLISIFNRRLAKCR